MQQKLNSSLIGSECFRRIFSFLRSKMAMEIVEVDVAKHLELLKNNRKDDSAYDAANILLNLSESNSLKMDKNRKLQEFSLPVGLSAITLTRIVLDWACRICGDINKAYSSSQKDIEADMMEALCDILVRCLQLLVDSKSSKYSAQQGLVNELSHIAGQAIIGFLILCVRFSDKDEIIDKAGIAVYILFSLPLYQPTLDVLLDFINQLSKQSVPVHTRLIIIFINESCIAVSRQSSQRKVFERICSLDVLESLLKLHHSCSLVSSDNQLVQHVKQQLQQSIEKLLNFSLFNEEMLNGIHGIASLRYNKFLSSMNDKETPGMMNSDSSVLVSSEAKSKTKRRKRKDGTGGEVMEHSESFHVSLLKSLKALMQSESSYDGYKLILSLFCQAASNQTNTIGSSSSASFSLLLDENKTLNKKRWYSNGSEASRTARLSFEVFVMLAEEVVDTKGQVNDQITSWKTMDCLSSLISCVNEYNCYRIHEDTDKKHLQCLKFFSSLLIKTLKHTTLCDDMKDILCDEGGRNDALIKTSLGCLGSLLELTHLTILEDIQIVLKMICICMSYVNISNTAVELFCTFIDSFYKLRKFPLLLDEFFKMVR